MQSCFCINSTWNGCQPPRNTPRDTLWSTHQVDDFVQEIGRAGRDGKPARSLLLFHGLHLKKCEPIMKEYAKTENKCLRKLLLSEFEATSMDSKEAHDCCVVCHSKCQCVGQVCQVDLLKVITEEAPKKLKQENKKC